MLMHGCRFISEGVDAGDWGCQMSFLSAVNKERKGVCLSGHNKINIVSAASNEFNTISQLPAGQVLLLVFGQLIDLDAPGFQPFAGDHIVDLL